MPSISIVMSVFNGATRLRATLDSIAAQSERDFELIVVDDGSTDGTTAILDDFAERDSRVRVIKQANSGLTRALIRGCAEARGALIARHDCGDVSHPERLGRQCSLFDDDPSLVLASCAVRFVGPEGEELYVARGDGSLIREGLLTSGADDIRALPHHGSAMFRREAYTAVGGYRPEFRLAQDLDLWIRLAQLGGIGILDEVLYDATVEPQSISTTSRAEQLELTEIAVALRRAPGDADLLAQAARVQPRKKRRGGEAAGLYFIARCLERRRDPAARRYLLRALRSNPLHLRAWAALLTGR